MPALRWARRLCVHLEQLERPRCGCAPVAHLVCVWCALEALGTERAERSERAEHAFAPALHAFAPALFAQVPAESDVEAMQTQARPTLNENFSHHSRTDDIDLQLA